MRSVFGLKKMENYQGDLTDILRASGGPINCPAASSESIPPPSLLPPTQMSMPSWQLPSSSDLMNFSSSSSSQHQASPFFGDPYLNMGDPLFQGLNMITADIAQQPGCSIINTRFGNNNNNNILSPRVYEDELNSPSCSVFSRIQISQSPKQIETSSSPITAAAVSSPRLINKGKGCAIVGKEMMNNNNNNITSNINNKSCLLDSNIDRHNHHHTLQISAPRNLGIKRRKSQAKKVVCIPAPAAANSRSSGEVVPSDLWAWRKYGQKPIKGSPYPRGYYRCSSSKGCSARKQVERSRTDPNMLVITYTSEHNHPWPTQRNALAGSTRSTHPIKPNAILFSKINNLDQEPKDQSSNETAALSPPMGASSSTIKEEFEDNGGNNNDKNQSYRPVLPDCHRSEDFFADLDELGGDPLSLLFTQGFTTSGENQDKAATSADPFTSFFDWSDDNNSNQTSSVSSKRPL